jgi:hypothetical protein
MGRKSSGSRIPAIFLRVERMIEAHWREFGLIVGFLGGLVAILDSFFSIRFTLYGEAFVEHLTSDGATTALLVIVLMTQVLLYQHIDDVLGEIESKYTDNDPHQESTDESDEVLPDGGSRDLPPRDSKGRFTTRDSGGANLCLILLGAVAGYVIAAESGVVN